MPKQIIYNEVRKFETKIPRITQLGTEMKKAKMFTGFKLSQRKVPKSDFNTHHY